MRIGIDFDNTIACYDGVFRRAAIERGLVPAQIGQSKNAVRDFLRAKGEDHVFTELQGYVYGSRMDLAAPYDGVREFLACARAAGHALCLVSHKTRHPFRGPTYDLHQAARGFLEAQHFVGPDGFDAQDIHFELTKEAKVARVSALGCDAFVDDLPEILALPGFPSNMRAILFDPEQQHAKAALPAFETHRSWASIASVLLGTTAALA